MRTAPNRRPGYALVELIAVITVITVILGLCAGMIHQLVKLDRDHPRLRSTSRTTSPAWPPTSGPTSTARTQPPSAPMFACSSLTDGLMVEYRILEREIARTVRQGDKIRHRESYRRPRHTSARMENTDGFLIIRLDRDPSGQVGSLYRDFRIEAELGRDRRLSKGGK